MMAEGPSCKFCLEEGNDEGNELISPCHCKGSVGHVHLKCMIRFMSLSGREHCPDCKKSFAFSETDISVAKAIVVLLGALCRITLSFLLGKLW